MARFAVIALLLIASTSQAAVLPVQSQTVTLQASYEVNRRYAGKVISRRHSQLTSALSGIVEEVLVAEGDSVAQGDLLLRLDQRHLQAQLSQSRAQLASAQAQVELNRANNQLAELALQRIRQLRDQGHASQAQLDESFYKQAAEQAALQLAQAKLQAAQAQLQAIEVDMQRSQIYAPFAGRIQRRLVDEGASLGPLQTALELVETQRQQSLFALPSQLFDQLQAKQQFEVVVAGNTVTADLVQVLPAMEAGSANMQVKLQFVDAPTFLDGAVAELLWQQQISAAGFWLPMRALSKAQRGLWSVLAVVEKDQQQIVERRLVEVLHSEADRVFVSGTLNDGEQVVTAGSQNLIPGQAVKSSNSVAAR